jgi:glycosyltransferase involved in cell wall biosynthesis
MTSVVTVFGLAPRYIGGSENYARELSLQLATHNWHSVLCFLTPPPDDVRRYLELPNVTIEVLEESDSPRPKLATIKKLSKILRTHHAKILHLHLVGFLGLYPWLARLRSVEQVFFTHHMSHPEGHQPQRAALWKRQLVRAINWPMSKVICVSDYNRQCIGALDVLPATRFERIYNGVDFSRVSSNGAGNGSTFRAKYGIPQDRIVVVQVSWIIPEKGIGDLLAAAQLVIAKNPAVHFVLIGEGDHREAFTRQAEELGLKEHVTWTGLVQDPFAEGVYDAADIVCQASRWEEAFGQVIAEAMAYGKPVIGTRVGGIPELIEDDVSGFLIQRGDVQALSDRVLRLAEDSELRKRMGRAGRLISRAKFNLEENVRQLVGLYLS